MFAKPLQTLFNLYPSGTLALVGGYVREYVLKDGNVAPDTEADFATTLPPHQSQALLEGAGLLAPSPGLQWGTVTAVVDGQTYDVTSTRSDVYTPGNRYPATTYGASWETDAQRRDFTCNAIYLYPSNTLFDPFKGLNSLKNRRVEFIGDPATRLQEDPLRLLRFLRFSAMYGEEGLTPDVTQALQNALPLLTTLTTARKEKEYTKMRKLSNINSILSRFNLSL